MAGVFGDANKHLHALNKPAEQRVYAAGRR